MKFQPDTLAGVNAISRYEPGRLTLGSVQHTGSVLVPWRGATVPWEPRQFDELQPAHFEAMLALQPEVVILGTGARLQFPHPRLTRALIERRIGLESMDTAAAVRTYNVLANEGRTVLGAFILGPVAD